LNVGRDTSSTTSNLLPPKPDTGESLELVAWSSVSTLIFLSPLLSLPAGLDRTPLSEAAAEGGEVIVLAEGDLVTGGPVEVVLPRRRGAR
jgi:hypothetical protein